MCAMAVKRVLRAERLRRVPTQFSWIDQRLVRDRHLERCGLDAIGLYLVLVTVADAQGLSYYGEASLECLLSMPAPRLAAARAELIRLDLIAYQRPLYQVLSLDTAATTLRVTGVHSVERGIAQLRARLAASGEADEPRR
jgi:hypothetical protein